MRSFRLQMLAAAIKPVMRWRMGRANDPKAMRRMFERGSKYLFIDPPFAAYTSATYQKNEPNDGIWASVRPSRSDKVILFLHGGGFVAGSPWGYRKVVAQLCRATGLRAFIPQYRLAPEHRLPRAYEDAMEAHAYLLGLGYRPSDIVIGGDSAGGGLAFSVLSTLCQRGQQPAAVFGWSACLDLTYSGASVKENAKLDHIFPGDRVHDLSRLILGDVPPTDPRLSPLFGEFPDCPPVLLQVSDTEILLDDSVRMEAKLREQGTLTRLEVWESAPHVVQLLYGYVPEAQQAIENTAQFIREQIGEKPPL